MRTDSTRLAPSSIDGARSLIKSQYGDQYLPDKPINYNQKKKNVQDAHEAIRPTSPNKTPEAIKQFLEPSEFKLYNLIWSRFIASQMNPSVQDRTTINIKADNACLLYTSPSPRDS